jgi:D-3-phosphoglycerate dehydrogenase
MSNTSRGEYAYTMIDLDETIRPETVAEIGRIPDVLRVRVVK